MTARLLVIAAGGTGGHMFPAQALAEEMLSRGWRVRLSTDARGARYAGGFPDAVPRQVVSAGTFARGGVTKLLAPFQILAGIAMATWRMRAERPACVIGFGGYPALPATAAAWILRRPRLLHEQNGVLGKVNELFARRVEAVACGTWPTALPEGTNGVPVGNPIRAAVRAHAGAPYVCTETGGPIHVVVIGGSQGARILSEVVPAAMATLPEAMRRRLVISHQARSEDQAQVRRAYDSAGIAAEIEAFFADVPERLANAQLVISRSGASSVADIAAIGRPSILIPLAAAKRDEQTANARGLASVGAASVMQERDATPDTLGAEVAAILTDPARAAAMAEAALATGKPDAAERLADLVERMATD